MARLDKSFTILLLSLGVVTGLLGMAFLFIDDEREELMTTGHAIEAAGPTDPEVLRRRRVVGRRPPPQAVASADVPRAIPKPAADEIAGTVRDESGAPLPAVRIESRMYFPAGVINYGAADEHEASATSDVDGRFRLMVPSHGVHRIEAVRAGFAPVRLENLRAGDEVEIELRRGGGLAGTVVAELSGQPISEARVSIRCADDPWTAKAETDELGRFRFDALPSKTIYVTVTSDEFLEVRNRAVVIAGGETSDVTLSLAAGKAIRGRVSDHRQSPVAGARVEIGEKSVVTDGLGEFRVSGLATSAHWIEIVADGFVTYRRSVNLSGSREEAEIDAELALGGSVAGTVLDDTGEPLAGVVVKAFWDWGGRRIFETGQTRFKTTTDENGVFSISGMSVSRAKYKIRASCEGYADAYSDRVTLSQEKRSVETRIIMSTGGRISGTVFDDRMSPIAGAKMTLRPSGVNEWSEKPGDRSEVIFTDATGRFEFSRLGAQRYRVSVLAAGFATQYRDKLEIFETVHLENINFTLESSTEIVGSVTDQDGRPLEGASIRLRSSRSWGSATTDESGEYRVTNIGEGPYYASAQLAGFAREKKRDTYPDAGRIDFELKRDGYVWGVVVDAETKAAIQGFRVELKQADPRRPDNWKTKASSGSREPDGRFKLHAVDGRYKLTVTAKGYLPWEKDAVVLDVKNDPDELRVELVAGGAIEGWARDHLGEAVSGATVYVRATDNEATAFREGFRTENDGYFYVGGLKSGTYEVAIAKNNSVPLTIRRWVTVLGGELTDVRFGLTEPSLLNLSVRDRAGRGVRRQKVTVSSLDDRPIAMKRRRWTRTGSEYELASSRTIRLDNSGLASFSDLSPGAYRLDAKRRGHRPITREIFVEEGVPLDVELAFGSKRDSSNTRDASR